MALKASDCGDIREANTGMGGVLHGSLLVILFQDFGRLGAMEALKFRRGVVCAHIHQRITQGRTLSASKASVKKITTLQ